MRASSKANEDMREEERQKDVEIDNCSKIINLKYQGI